MFHINGAGVVDYLEVRPAPNGAAADRSSPFQTGPADFSIVGQVQARLGEVHRRHRIVSLICVWRRAAVRDGQPIWK